MTQEEREFPALDPDLRARIVRKAAETVKDKYIFEGDAKAMSELLLAKLEKGEFDAADVVPVLTQALTRVLRSVRDDLHLAAVPWMPPANEEDSSDDLGEARSAWPRHNYEFRKLEILLGNVGYLDLRGFPSAEAAGPTATAAMQFLANTDALIFDLRDNGGGEDLVYLLMSYLFDRPTHVHTARHRDHDEQNWTYGYVPGPRFAEQPVYVVTSRSTFSAAEDFSYNLQKQGRVTVIGEPTRGGAHPIEFYRFPELYLELVMPNAYSENPITHGNWEASGVVPDLVVPADEALDVAHEKALEVLLAKAADDDERGRRQWALESVRLRRKPFSVDRALLTTYAGGYGSSVEVELGSSSLSISWDRRRAYALVPLTKDRFEFDHGTQRVTFVVEHGQSTALVWQTEDGEVWRMERRPHQA